MGDAALAQKDLGGVQFAEVAVDTETGMIRVERVVAVQDCGRPMNPKLIESQVQGGVLMGLSYALSRNGSSTSDRPHGQSEPRAIQTASARARRRRSKSSAGELSGPERNRRLRHRRAVQHRHRAGDRQRRLQCDRRAPALAADDAGQRARRARPMPARSDAMDSFDSGQAKRSAKPRRRPRLVAEAMLAPPDAAGPSPSSRRAASTCSI